MVVSGQIGRPVKGEVVLLWRTSPSRTGYLVLELPRGHIILRMIPLFHV